MNKRLKKKKAKHQRDYIILSSPKNNTPEWKRYKARVKLSKRHIVEIRNIYTHKPLIQLLNDVTDLFNSKEEELNE